jgi:hypothetical protein
MNEQTAALHDDLPRQSSPPAEDPGRSGPVMYVGAIAGVLDHTRNATG